MKWRQISFAHLLRKFIAFSERNGIAGALRREVLGYTALVFEYWHGYQAGRLRRREFELWLCSVRRGLEQALERGGNAAIERLLGSCADIIAPRDVLWTFVTPPDDVEPTNNHAYVVRGIRKEEAVWRSATHGCA
ncbi:MAG: hypothetical protein RL701_6782 [Pseudomonadota bacterium]